jgi:glycine betaine/proline transport system substrate-binding protein
MIKPGRKPYLIPVVGIFLAMAMVMVVSACAGGDGLTAEDVKQAVREEIQAAPQQESLTAEDVQKIVQDVMMEADTGEEEPALTAQEVQQIVQSAMEAQAGMAMEDALSAEDVQKIVQDAMMASAMMEESLTPEEIEQIVQDAMMAGAMMMEGPKEVIVFADLDWPSAQLQNAIARYIVENGYGYPTDVLFGGTIPLWQGLLGGDIDVFMEAWLPNMQDLWDAALADGSVIPVGKSLDDNWQSAFVVPTYLLEQNPGLVKVQDLRDHMELFPQENGKVILWTCLASWACLGVNAGQVESYGLDDILELKVPGTTAALFASLEGAYVKDEAWLGYLWGPSKPAAELDLTLLEEPACAEGQEPITGCAYGIASIRIAVHPTLVQRAPEIAEFLRRWDFSAAINVAADTYIAEADVTPNSPEVVIWFLKNYEASWTKWVPSDVASNVKAALAE